MLFSEYDILGQNNDDHIVYGLFIRLNLVYTVNGSIVNLMQLIMWILCPLRLNHRILTKKVIYVRIPNMQRTLTVRIPPQKIYISIIVITECMLYVLW